MQATEGPKTQRNRRIPPQHNGSRSVELLSRGVLGGGGSPLHFFKSTTNRTASGAAMYNTPRPPAKPQPRIMALSRQGKGTPKFVDLRVPCGVAATDKASNNKRITWTSSTWNTATPSQRPAHASCPARKVSLTMCSNNGKVKTRPDGSDWTRSDASGKLAEDDPSTLGSSVRRVGREMTRAWPSGERFTNARARHCRALLATRSDEGARRDQPLL